MLWCRCAMVVLEFIESRGFNGFITRSDRSESSGVGCSWISDPTTGQRSKAMSPDRLEGKIRNAIRIVEEEVQRNIKKHWFSLKVAALTRWFMAFRLQGAFHEEGLCSHEKGKEWALRCSLGSGLLGFGDFTLDLQAVKGHFQNWVATLQDSSKRWCCCFQPATQLAHLERNVECWEAVYVSSFGGETSRAQATKRTWHWKVLISGLLS